MLHRKVNLDVGKHTGTFGRVHPFELHQSGGIRTETVFLHKERNENPVEQAYQIITVHPVENIVREGKLQLAVYAVRLVE